MLRPIRGRALAVFRTSLFILTTLCELGGCRIHAQQVTNQAPPPASSQPAYPDAVALPQSGAGAIVTIDAATQSERSNVFVLDGAVVITYLDRVIRADHIEYDANTGTITAQGHVSLSGGPNQEHLEAFQGTFNLRTGMGSFQQVKGSVGLTPPHPGAPIRVSSNQQPLLFSGRLVVKTGPATYDIYDGAVTSCMLPNPDWQLTSSHFAVDDVQAKGYRSTFRLLNVPLLYLPYVTHPTDPATRESGFMIPSPGYSGTKGFITQEQFYLVLNRSMDLTLGASFYSSIGFAEDATFRYKGAGLDFVRFRYTGALDRRVINQGGEDAVLSMRRDLSERTRIAADIEYLSSYVYREAFTENFNQAVTSDILSTAYIAHAANGLEVSALADRYQGIKLIARGVNPQEQVHILHTPTVSLYATEHHAAGTSLLLSLESSISGLHRTQPNFESGGIVERLDLHPEVSAPFSIGAWRLRPALSLRETAYSRSFVPGSSVLPGAQGQAFLSRSDVQFSLAARAPVIERTFVPTRWNALLGDQLKHTIEPEATYRLTRGVDNFRHVLRFDSVDVVADTNEVEYGLTQRIFRRRAQKASCFSNGAPEPKSSQAAADAIKVDRATSSFDTESSLNPDPAIASVNAAGQEADLSSCQATELISWRLSQKYFFDPSFGGAVVSGRRNIFDTTLSLSGVAFLTEPRDISPLVSRLRIRSSAHTDVEWDFDLDTGAKKLTSSNVFLDLHAVAGFFGALSYARLNAPGRFYTEGGGTSTAPTGGVTSLISDFNQLRVLVGFGSPLKPGLSVAGNTGVDLKSLYGATSTGTSSSGLVTTRTVFPALLQYATVQASYNWNCCGFSLEYRKFELGSVRNEGTYKFNFTLANVATVGNLRRAERLF